MNIDELLDEESTFDRWVSFHSEVTLTLRYIEASANVLLMAGAGIQFY